MGLGANRCRQGVSRRLRRGVVALGTHNVSKRPCREACLNSLIRRKDNDMDLFIGLDVSLATTAACVLDEHGKVLKELKVDSEPEALIAFLRELAGSAALIGLEAGPLCQSASNRAP